MALTPRQRLEALIQMHVDAQVVLSHADESQEGYGDTVEDARTSEAMLTEHINTLFKE